MDPVTLVATLTVNPAVDLACTIDRLVPDRKLRCSAAERHPGGGGLNVARVLHRFDVPVLALWACGGPIGALLADLLDAEGLPHEPIPLPEPTRENVIVTETATNDQYRLGIPGPTFTEADTERCRAAVRNLPHAPTWLVLSGSLAPGMPPDFYRALAEEAPAGTRVAVDTSGPALREALEAPIHLAKPDRRELEELAGHTLPDEAAVARAALDVTATGSPGMLAVSLGPDGALLVHEGEVFRARAPRVPVASRVGAGDSMVAGLLVGLLRGDPPQEVLRLGVAAGTATVTTPGSALCSPGDVARLLAATRPAPAPRLGNRGA